MPRLDSHVRAKTEHHGGLTEDELETFIAQLGHRHSRVGKARRNQQGIMGALLIPANDLIVGQGTQPYCVDKIAEEMAPRGLLIAVDMDSFVKNPRATASARDVLEVDSSPCGSGPPGNGGEHRWRALPQSNEINTFSSGTKIRTTMLK